MIPDQRSRTTETRANPARIASLVSSLKGFVVDSGQSRYLRMDGSALGLLSVAAAAAAGHDHHVTCTREDGSTMLLASAATEHEANELADRADRADVHLAYFTEDEQATAREIIAYSQALLETQLPAAEPSKRNRSPQFPEPFPQRHGKEHLTP